MVSILAIEVDLISLGPAMFASILSLVNWFKMNKAADIHPNEIISYGFISSSFHGGMQLCIPIILHNDGARKGLVKSITIGFQNGNGLKYLDIIGKAKMNEIDVNKANLMDWNKFEEEGYKMYQPTYPIVVEGGESTNVVLIAQSEYDDNIIPSGKQTNCIIEVKFDKKGINKVIFPFRLSNEDKEVDNRLRWLEPMASY